MTRMKPIALTALFLLAAGAVYAQAGTTGSILIQGNVPGILEITVTPAGDAANLDLTTNVSGKLIGTVLERSNKKTGYTITLESANASGSTLFFKSADSTNSDQLAYTLTYDGTPLSFSGGIAALSSGVKTSGTGDQKDVRISYNGADTMLYEDTYSDTLTFTISSP